MIRVGFLGAGNMAYALAGAMAASGMEITLVPCDISPERLELFCRDFSPVEPAADLREAVLGTDLCFLALKPQVLPEVLPEVKDSAGLFVSIAAGLSLGYLESLAPRGRFIRIMPNTPALVGEMAAGFSLGRLAGPEDRELVLRLLRNAGLMVEVEESLMDGVTGVSGSGPAFFARIAEAFILAGTRLGLSPEDARALVLRTMRGTAVLMEERNMSPQELVDMVSSPNGTTVAGREVLESSDFGEVVARTVFRTAERSRELGK